MVFDFSKVKKTIKAIIDRDVDHKLLVPNKYERLGLNSGQDPVIEFTTRTGEKITHQSPRSAICQLDSTEVTTEIIIDYLKQQIFKELPSNVDGLEIELREESVAGNYFRYSHGLKKHDGNCQRIAHGHRSQIQIWSDGERDNKLEKDIAVRWHDIYLGSQEDIVWQTDERIKFAYSTEQGNFKLELPIQYVHLLPEDSTVECIAEHILELLPKTKKLKVKAFEGIGKGALAIRN